MKNFLKLLGLGFLSVLSLVACSDDDHQEEPESGKLKVLEYCPAPGQFINEGMDCKTMAEANKWAQERLEKGLFVSLGAFGGYMIVKMPEEIKNRKGYDFAIAGNPFEGSSEPGIVYVSEDVNRDGLANDPWYELKGSEQSEGGYEVTYYRPSVPGEIHWKDNKGQEGVINYLAQFHDQMYYPQWIEQDSYTLKGSLLQDKVVEEGGVWKNGNFEWGYADNMGSDMAKKSGGSYLHNQFDIDNAIDSGGKTVNLTQIHFVKVQSAILKNVPTIGEVSTEVAGFKAF